MAAKKGHGRRPNIQGGRDTPVQLERQKGNISGFFGLATALPGLETAAVQRSE